MTADPLLDEFCDDPDERDGEALDGAEILDELRAALVRYVVLPDAHTADALALWIAATHALPAFHHAPRLAIKSPEKRCGKSRLLDVIEGTCHAPLVTVSATPAAIFRSIGGEHPPTLLVDETDALFGSKKQAEANEELRALLNAGHQRGRPALRCVGPNQTPTEFETFAMAALAGIGDLPDTIEDRSIIVTIRRRKPTETVAKYRTRRDGPALLAIREQLAAWLGPNIDHLRDMEPPMPVDDRAADTWEPLVCVADLAGGDWPDRARSACAAMVRAAEENSEGQSLNVKLLADVRGVFDMAGVAFLSSADLVGHLLVIGESPWADFELNARKLALRLGHFGVKPGHDTTGKVRGWRLDQLADAFARYLRQDPSDPSDNPARLHKHSDGSSLSDGSTRQTHHKRQNVSASQRASLTGGRVLTDPPPEDEGKTPCSVRACIQPATRDLDLGGRSWSVCPDHDDCHQLAIEGDQLMEVDR